MHDKNSGSCAGRPDRSQIKNRGYQGNTRFYWAMRLEALCLELTSGAIALGFGHFEKSLALAGVQTFTAAGGGLA
jgi:hypothetical protein